MEEKLIVILYVKNQDVSTEFYRKLLGIAPVLWVPGMTEFRLCDGVLLGLMPEEGIASILADKTPHPSSGNGIPRAELYIYRESLDEITRTARAAGATLISPEKPRSWGDSAVYFSDPDGHIIAFARKAKK